MSSNPKVLEKEMQDEMVGMLIAMSIVSKRLATRLSKLDENEQTAKSSKESGVKT
jgi:hypothetical protein